MPDVTNDTGDDPIDRYKPSLERLVFFSDAVIAIAMTLLALELPVPTGDTNAKWWDSFHGHWPEYLAFLISFVIIGNFWKGHHRIFRYVTATDRTLIGRNLWCLFTVVLMPFASKTIFEHESRTVSLGVTFYALIIAANSAAWLSIVSHLRRPGLTSDELPAGELRTTRDRTMITGGIFLLSIPIAFINPTAGLFSWILLAFGHRLYIPIRRRLAR